ncbi:MAG TPA: lytic transglycosylase domain-containing protein [Xanthobacteraceae bacterium]|jgi:hypothetical protein
MRLFLVLVILWLGVGSASPEPEYNSIVADSIHSASGTPFPSLVDIESATGKSDRLDENVALPPGQLKDEIDSLEAAQPLITVATTDDDPAAADSADDRYRGPGGDPTHPHSLANLCNALLTSAQDNNLPVAFFANLIWQESGLRNDVISRKGAVGVAQFMPETAAETGLHNPFDPLQAIPASARFLRLLREQFGNLGFVAAAYNAGPGRVAEWLENRRGLPRETREYVANITGRSVEQWRKTPPDDSALKFIRRLPCRDMPMFADLEQTQQQQAQAEQAQGEQKQSEQTTSDESAKADDHAQRHVAARKHPRPHAHRDEIRTARAAQSDESAKAAGHTQRHVAARKHPRPHAHRDEIRSARTAHFGKRRQAEQPRGLHERRRSV